MLRNEGIIFSIAFDTERFVRYICTTDRNFITPEGIRIGSTVAEVKRMIDTEIIPEQGWGYHVQLKSGWRVAFGQGDSMTEGELKNETRVRWIFKRQ